MAAAGRPTAYRREFCELARNYCLLGATNADLAGFFGVSGRTVDNWIARHPPFAAAVRGGRVVADARVARCLYERAVGYDYTVRRTVLHRGCGWSARRGICPVAAAIANAVFDAIGVRVRDLPFTRERLLAAIDEA